MFATVRFGDVSTNLTDSAPRSGRRERHRGRVAVEPGAVVVSVPLLPTATTKTVPVLWTLRGAVANGYWISQVTTNPVAVTVSGAQSAIAQMQRVETEPVDVTGVNASGTVRAVLILPEGVTLMEPVTATVTVTVVPLAGTRSFFSAVVITNAAANTEASVDIGTVTATVAGPAPTLAALGADAVTASVDAAGRGPGTYLVDVAIKLPSGVTLQRATNPCHASIKARIRSESAYSGRTASEDRERS